MEKEKLIIKNFGPIKHVELELGRFNVLIGEQGTGKTMIGKILSCCRYFSYITEINEGGLNQAFFEWGIDENFHPETYISYSNQDYKVEIDFLEDTYQTMDENGMPKQYSIAKPVFVVRPKSMKFKSLLVELETIKPRTFDILTLPENVRWQPSHTFFKNSVSQIMDNPIFVPTERALQSIFSLGKSSIQNINDSLFNQFAKLDQIQRRFTNDTEIEPLGIEYRNLNGFGEFRKKGTFFWYKLQNAPSGYKTTIPIILLLKYYTEIVNKRKTFIIDEPEISLFPETQNKLVKALAFYLNLNKTFLLTTHSPYILTSLNNLMYAWQVGQKNEEEVSKIIDKKYWVNPSEVSAYQLMSDGTAKNIIADDGLIMAENIDSVSNTISYEYDSISAISYGE